MNCFYGSIELKPHIPFLDLLIQYSWLLEQDEEREVEEKDEPTVIRGGNDDDGVIGIHETT